MQQFKELSIVTPNKPGKMARVLGALALARINLIAIDSSSGYDLNLVRLVTSHPAKTKSVMARLGYSATEAAVLAVTVLDKPGQLNAITRTLARAGVNIDYMYGSASEFTHPALVFFHVADPEAAKTALHRAHLA